MQNSAIEWTDHTFNPWRGCTKVSPGCANCYAEALSKRTGHGEYRKGVPRERMSAAYWKQPLKWNREAGFAAESAAALDRQYYRTRPRVFCASLADWLDDEVPIEWLADLLKLIRGTPNLDWLLLTKRPENWRPRLTEVFNAAAKEGFVDLTAKNWLNGDAPANVWIGATVENQEYANKRIPKLLKIPARVRFLSCEPLLGPVEFSDVGSRSDAVSQLGKPVLDGIHWIIGGAESGPKARPCHPDNARSLRDQCVAAGVKFFWKQWGEWVPRVPSSNGSDQFGDFDSMRQRDKLVDRNGAVHCAAEAAGEGYAPMSRVGKKAAGRLLDGREWSEFPNT